MLRVYFMPTIITIQASRKLYTPKVDSNILREEGLLGEGISQPYFSDEYRVFVQSMGSGKRHLQAHTHIILDNPVSGVTIILLMLPLLVHITTLF